MTLENQVKALWRKGRGVTDIADKLGIPVAQVRFILGIRGW